jgi:hypothetical protein
MELEWCLPGTEVSFSCHSKCFRAAKYFVARRLSRLKIFSGDQNNN